MELTGLFSISFRFSYYNLNLFIIRKGLIDAISRKETFHGSKGLSNDKRVSIIVVSFVSTNF